MGYAPFSATAATTKIGCLRHRSGSSSASPVWCPTWRGDTIDCLFFRIWWDEKYQLLHVLEGLICINGHWNCCRNEWRYGCAWWPRHLTPPNYPAELRRPLATSGRLHTSGEDSRLLTSGLSQALWFYNHHIKQLNTKYLIAGSTLYKLILLDCSNGPTGASCSYVATEDSGRGKISSSSSCPSAWASNESYDL